MLIKILLSKPPPPTQKQTNLLLHLHRRQSQLSARSISKLLFLHVHSFYSISTRLPSSLATIIEDESLIIQPTRPGSEKTSQSCQLSSDRHEHTTEGLSDTIMSRLFAQDESSQQDLIHSTTKSVSNDGIEMISSYSNDHQTSSH